MAKIRKIAPARIRKITGGKDPIRLVEEFMTRRGFEPEECLQQRTSDVATWSISLKDEEELEITLEGLGNSAETTLYMGLNVFSIPMRDCHKVLVAALTLADTLIGVKLSLVNYDLVLSVTAYTANMGVDDVDYFFELITRQKTVVQDTLGEEVGG